ncbi:MAG TPA: hypothetical protein VM912_02560, partial [Terriglobales bacterium]|nr:hypothetical protein [Terriglobales bacterium]
PLGQKGSSRVQDTSRKIRYREIKSESEFGTHQDSRLKAHLAKAQPSAEAIGKMQINPSAGARHSSKTALLELATDECRSSGAPPEHSFIQLFQAGLPLASRASTPDFLT